MSNATTWVRYLFIVAGLLLAPQTTLGEPFQCGQVQSKIPMRCGYDLASVQKLGQKVQLTASVIYDFGKNRKAIETVSLVIDCHKSTFVVLEAKKSFFEGSSLVAENQTPTLPVKNELLGSPYSGLYESLCTR